MTDGIVNVLKPPGMTSHDVVSRIRRIYGIKKAGHSGTLDPDAAGVLPVFIGNATRLLEYAATATKRYRAEGMFGIRTDTGDDSGNILETKPVPAISATEFENVLQQFRGKILQVPPMYSALKVNGKKLYEYAREGIIIERPARPVEIFRLDCVKLYPPYFSLDIECSKGTYVRTLLEDIAAAVHIGKSTALQIFHQGINQSPIAYLIRYRLKQAAILLTSTEKTIASIAEATGFSDVAHFSRSFKRFAGCTPGEYRNQRD